MTSYRNKNGAAYGAACAMAARLAGCSDPRTTGWRRFGEGLGFLGQFRNDQEDLITDRDEDLTNGTATYLLACLLDHPGRTTRRHLLDLLPHAQASPDARAEIERAMLMPDIVGRYLRQVELPRRSTLARLEALNVNGVYASRLRQLVEEAAAPVPRFFGGAQKG